MCFWDFLPDILSKQIQWDLITVAESDQRTDCPTWASRVYDFSKSAIGCKLRMPLSTNRYHAIGSSRSIVGCLPFMLLMEEILHHLGWKNLVNNGIYCLSTGAGFQPSTVWTSWFMMISWKCREPGNSTLSETNCSHLNMDVWKTRVSLWTGSFQGWKSRLVKCIQKICQNYTRWAPTSFK